MAALWMGSNRPGCEDLIRVQIRQVLLEARVQHLDVGATARLNAAVTRIADAWAADARHLQARLDEHDADEQARIEFEAGDDL